MVEDCGGDRSWALPTRAGKARSSGCRDRAEIVEYELKLVATNKKPRHSLEPGVFCSNMAWR